MKMARGGGQLLGGILPPSHHTSNTYCGRHSKMKLRGKKGGELDGSHFVDSVFTSTTDTEVTADDRSLASHPPSSPPSLKSMKAMDDSSLVRASSYLHKNISAKGSLADSSAEESRAERLDDRFLTSINRCGDHQTLQELRRDRSEVAPIIIEEEADDDENAELWKGILIFQMKPFLQPTTIHRMSFGLEAEHATPFVAQHTGVLHPDVPQIFIV